MAMGIRHAGNDATGDPLGRRGDLLRRLGFQFRDQAGVRHRDQHVAHPALGAERRVHPVLSRHRSMLRRLPIPVYITQLALS